MDTSTPTTDDVDVIPPGMRRRITPVEYQGRTYRVLGVLNGVQPELGTVVGPTWYEEMGVVIVIGDDNGKPFAVLGLAQREDFKAAEARCARGVTNFQSMTEINHLGGQKFARIEVHSAGSAERLQSIRH